MSSAFQAHASEEELARLRQRSVPEQFQHDVDVWQHYLNEPATSHHHTSTYTNECKNIIKRLFLLLENANVQFRNTGATDYQRIAAINEQLPIEKKLNYAALLSHGGRIVIQIPPMGDHYHDPDKLLNWLVGGEHHIADNKKAHAQHHKPIYKRKSATHSLTRRHGQLKELLLSPLMPLHWGKLAIDMIGQRHFGMNIDLKNSQQHTFEDGAHGHLYIYWLPPTKEKLGGLMIGCEHSQPGKVSHYGYKNSRKKPSEFSLTGGLKFSHEKFSNYPIRPDKIDGLRIELSQDEVDTILSKKALDFTLAQLTLPVGLKIEDANLHHHLQFIKKKLKHIRRLQEDINHLSTKLHTANHLPTDAVTQFTQLNSPITQIETLSQQLIQYAEQKQSHPEGQHQKTMDDSTFLYQGESLLQQLKNLIEIAKSAHYQPETTLKKKHATVKEHPSPAPDVIAENIHSRWSNFTYLINHYETQSQTMNQQPEQMEEEKEKIHSACFKLKEQLNIYRDYLNHDSQWITDPVLKSQRINEIKACQEKLNAIIAATTLLKTPITTLEDVPHFSDETFIVKCLKKETFENAIARIKDDKNIIIDPTVGLLSRPVDAQISHLFLDTARINRTKIKQGVFFKKFIDVFTLQRVNDHRYVSELQFDPMNLRRISEDEYLRWAMIEVKNFCAPDVPSTVPIAIEGNLPANLINAIILYCEATNVSYHNKTTLRFTPSASAINAARHKLNQTIK